MAAPIDTIKLARQFEAAGFSAQQAGDMAAAIADARREVLGDGELALSYAKMRRAYCWLVGTWITVVIVVSAQLWIAALWLMHALNEPH
jgi:hypothetical protein